MGIITKIILVIGSLLNFGAQEKTNEPAPAIEEAKFDIPSPVIDNPPEIAPNLAVATSSALEQGGVATIDDKPEIPDYLRSCVAFVRKFSKYNNFPRIKAAKDLEALIFEPKIDSIAIFNAGGRYGVYGHMGIVRAVDGDYFLIEEANLKPNQRTTRLVKWRGEEKDQFIKGFFGW